jgi:hypothetical protein
VNSHLGDGWTIDRVRTYADDATAKELSLDRAAFVDSGNGRVRLMPQAIVMVGGLILVRHEGDWYMGEADEDGTVVCWSAYGTDLGEAIDGL